MRTAKPNSLEIRREKWLRQLMADPEIDFSHFRVATVIGWHMNRRRGGVAWPGINTIARINRRTVIRAIGWLEQRKHLSVTRSRVGKRNRANRYTALLKREHVMSLPSGTAMSLPSGTAMSPEPYTEPLTEPPIPIRISDAVGTASLRELERRVEEGGNREGSKEKGTTPIESPLSSSSLRALCFSEAVEHYGPGARPVVAQALDHRGVAEDECLDEIRGTIEAGGDLQELAYSLWRP